MRFLMTLPVLLVGVAFAEDSRPFDECHLRFADDPRLRAQCIYSEGRATQTQREATTALTELAASHPREGWPHYYLGRMSLHMGGGPALERAAELFSEGADVPGEIRARASLVLLLSLTDQLDDAARELDELRRLSVLSNVEADRAVVALAEAHYRIAPGVDLDQAYLHLLDALDALEPAAKTHYPYLFECLRSLVHMAVEFDDADAANRYSAQAVRLAEQAGIATDEAKARYNRTYSLLRTRPPGERERRELVDELRRQLEVALDVGNLELEGHTRRHLALMDGVVDARANLERCADLARQIDHPRLERRCLLSLASTVVAADPTEAEDLVGRAYAVNEADYLWKLLYGWDDTLSVLWETQPAEQAIEASEAVLDTIEGLRRAQIGSASEQLLSAWADVYYWIAGRLLRDARDGEDLSRAFAVMERLRAQTLREALGMERTPDSELPETLVVRRRTLEEALAVVYRRLLDPRTERAQRAELLGELERLERREAEVVGEIARYEPQTMVLEAPATDLLERVRANLAEDEALVSYQLGSGLGWNGRFRGGAWAQVVTYDDVRAVPLAADRAVMERKLELFLGLSDPESGEALVDLYEAVLGPALDELPPAVDKLVIVPDGLLHVLPFPLLRAAPEASPVVASYELSIAPSASLWLQWKTGAQSRPQHPEGAALVLANPQLPAAGDPSSQRSWVLESGASLGPLPAAQWEGKRIVRRLGEASRLVSASEASEAFLKTVDLTPFGALHLAVHAVVNTRRPNRSGVVLSEGDGEDGILRPPEITRLRGLEGKLVVLSSCSGATGSVLRGEGVLSLARAFFLAGSHAVVASLWPLDDREAARFFDDLYAHLSRGRTVRGAVAATQREWIEEGRSARTWAGVVVLGNGDLVLASSPASGRFVGSPLALLGGFAALIALALWIAGRRRAR